MQIRAGDEAPFEDEIGDTAPGARALVIQAAQRDPPVGFEEGVPLRERERADAPDPKADELREVRFFVVIMSGLDAQLQPRSGEQRVAPVLRGCRRTDCRENRGNCQYFFHAAPPWW